MPTFTLITTPAFKAPADADTAPKRVPLSSLKRGEYVRLTPGPNAPVWVRGDFDRSAKAYELRRFDDINHTTLRKGTALVFAGFTF